MADLNIKEFDESFPTLAKDISSGAGTRFARAVQNVDPTGAPAPSGSGSSPVATYGAPLTYTEVAGSPFTLTASWAKVATTTSATTDLIMSPIASATTFDLEWASVAAGASAPVAAYGIAVGGGVNGVPIGDIYMKSATGQIAVVYKAV